MPIGTAVSTRTYTMTAMDTSITEIVEMGAGSITDTKMAIMQGRVMATAGGTEGVGTRSEQCSSTAFSIAFVLSIAVSHIAARTIDKVRPVC